MITPFTLPSNPSIQVQLREATVADAIDFADLDDSHEEELTTMFLGRMQNSGTVRDPRKWTAEDRRFALYWYWLHTSKDHEVALSYECRHCGGTHVYLQDFRELADHYASINEGPEREGLWKDERIIVRPLSGADMETLERMRLGFGIARTNTEEPVNKKARTMMMFERLAMCVTFVSDKRGADKAQGDERRKKIMALTVDEFSAFADLVYGLLSDMKHGLETEYADGRLFLLMPVHECPEGGGQTRLRYPFRNSDYIPGL